MSYTTDKRTNPATIAAVIAVHAGIGYALISGLAMTVIKEIPVVTLAEFIPDTPPPPENPPPPPTAAESSPVLPRAVVAEVPTLSDGPVLLVPPPAPVVPLAPPAPVAVAPAPLPAQDLSRPAAPRGNRAAWVTSEDYPPSALRDHVEGTTTIHLAIGADGRVTACSITSSSGSAMLDEAACRLYARRARFTPALDAAGQPAAATRTDRVTWRIPD